MEIKTTCTKCAATIRLDLGEMSKEEAVEAAEMMDRQSRECPGGHVELSGFRRMWNLDDAIHRAYDLGEAMEPIPVINDKEYVEGLQAEGKAIVDGGANRVPELNLPRIHDFKHLEHMGFGNFQTKAHLFLRCDSPRGTRFYEQRERRQ